MMTTKEEPYEDSELSHEFVCCLCGKTVQEFGNDPGPLDERPNLCCDECLWEKVMPARMPQGKRTSAS
jgi:hypothetical protein